MKKETFDVTGMSCAACSARVDKAVRATEGVKEVSVNLPKNSMTVEFDESATVFVIVFKGTVGGADKNLDLEIKER